MRRQFVIALGVCLLTLLEPFADAKNKALRKLAQGQAQVLEELAALQQQVSDFQDIFIKDECRDGTHRCTGDTHCINSMILYECRCNDGFTGDGYQCTDIDECSGNVGICPNNSVCLNTPGSYRCACASGYTIGGENSVCVDIDECMDPEYPCDTNGICENTPGSFSCRCFPGFIVGEDGCMGPRCHEPFVNIPGVGCIHVVETKMPWEKARDNCLEFYGDLFVAHSKRHLESLAEYLLRNNPGQNLFVGIESNKWLNSNRDVEEWSTPYLPSNWACGQLWRSDFKLYDTNCEVPTYSLCHIT